MRLQKSDSFVPVVLFAMIMVCLSACTYDKELLEPTPAPDCTTSPASFNGEIFPLVTTKCAIPACHDASGQGGQVFQSYNQISSAKDLIYLRAIVQKTMPASGFLTTAEYNSLKCWLESGAPND